MSINTSLLMDIELAPEKEIYQRLNINFSQHYKYCSKVSFTSKIQIFMYLHHLFLF